MLENQREILSSWNGYQKLSIKINWFRDNFQASSFVAKYGDSIKTNEN